MPIFYVIIISSWAALMVVWLIGSFNVKRDLKTGRFTAFWSRFWGLRIVIIALVVFAIVRAVSSAARYSGANVRMVSVAFMPPVGLGWIGAALTVLGVALAIWARVHLGRNWSATPSVKERHELVTSGPYRTVRHPIYTGIILAAFGTALSGSTFGIGIFLVLSVVFYLRIPVEERIMLQLFPDQYPGYRERTWALIPWVW